MLRLVPYLVEKRIQGEIMLFGRKSDRADADADQLAQLRGENERLRRAVGELSLLNELAADIGASDDLDAITRQIVRRSIRALKAEQGVITLVDEQGDDAPLKTLVRTAIGADRPESLRPDQHLLGWMQAHRAPLRLNDPQRDERFAFVPWPDALRSILCVPLTVRSRLIAVLTVYNKRDKAGFSEADQRLLTIIAAQTAQVIENARLVEEEKALLRMREELRLAYEIQTNLLPQAAPELPGYDIAGRSVPAQTVGGDYFDFIELEPQRWALCVGDAVGKGLPAALLMATVQATLRGQARSDLSARANLERSNELLCRSIRDGEFVTLFYGCLDATTHHFVFANAGHNRPLWARANGTIGELASGGLVLGAMEGQGYGQEDVILHSGDWIVMYSDGLTEATDAHGTPFGSERMERLLRTHRTDSANALVDRLIAAVRRHTQGIPQADDITIVTLKRL